MPTHDELYALPSAAIAAFERATKLAVSVHDLGGLLKAYLPAERMGHTLPLCKAVKSTHERQCVQFESTRLRAGLKTAPGGGVKLCHAGLIEWYTPYLRDGRLEWVLFAGLRTRSEHLREPLLEARPVQFPFAKKMLPQPADSEESAYILELLQQLNCRLQLWCAELANAGRSIESAPQEGECAPSDPHARAHLIRSFVAERHRFPVSLGDLANFLRLSDSRASHAVREACGKSFAKLLSEARLNTAAGLLKHSSLTILDVALRSGFSDVSNFHDAFRRRFKTTPHRFRRRAQHTVDV